MIGNTKNIVPLRRKLLYWFRANGRVYPWRETSDPWRILIAEMMLRRTKADQVEKVYREFINYYRSPRGLLKGSPRKIKSILSPLGLNWRQQNFFDLAEILINDFNAKIPSTREELKQLPGVGDYVAGPSHVLPTGGTARFFSGLGIEDFVKSSHIISYTKKALEEARDSINKLTGIEGLPKHMEAVNVRFK